MIRLRCKDHPHYKGLKVPTDLCYSCWYIFHVATFINQSTDVRLQCDQGKGYYYHGK
jgi:hypothetical protein